MKRTNQLMAESAVIGSLFVLLVVGGSLAGMSRPADWTTLTSPDAVAVRHDPNALSLYYNLTLSLLGEGEFGNVSQALSTFPFVNVSPRVNQTALTANSEFANSTSPRLASLGVPAQPYAVGEGLVQAEVASLGSECQSLLDLLPHPD